MKAIFFKDMPKDKASTLKGKLYIIYRGMPNTPDTTEVLHGVHVNRADKALSRRSTHNIKTAWIEPFFRFGERPKVKIVLIQDFERKYVIVHPERIKPTADKKFWRHPIRMKA